MNIALTACVMLLSGCVSMSGIEPQAKITQADTLATGKNISFAPRIVRPTDEWWKAYRDAQLNDLIVKATVDSPTLRIAKARVALALAFADGMHAETLPNINADGAMTRERFTAMQFIPPPWGGNTDWNNRAAVSLGYDLDLWGRQESNWHAFVDETRTAAAEAQQVKLELQTAIVRSYIQLAMQFTLRDIAEQHQELIEQRVSIARRGLAAGIATEMEVSEAETSLPAAHAQIEAIDARIGLLRNQLAAFAGQGPGAGDAIARPVINLDAPVGLPDRLSANLIGRRPDVQALRWRVEAAQRRIEGAKAEFYPDINLLAFAGLQAIGFGQLISNAAAIAGVGPAISLPIFDGGRRRSHLSAQAASYDIAVENYNEALVRSLQDVSDQLVVLNANARQRGDAEQALHMAKKAHELARNSYLAGLSNYQHVLDNHAVVLRQQEAVAQLQAVRLDTYAGLMRALGGGFTDSSLETKQP